MSATNLAFNAGQSRSGGRMEKGGGAAGVEIVGFPQMLYTRTIGDPDMLFVPLLDAARSAFAMIERLSGHGEDRTNAVQLSGMQLASALLRDSSFSLAARGLAQDNLYTVNLDAGTIYVNTRLYAVISRRTSLFKVEIAGKLSGGMFVVRKPGEGTLITQVEESRLRQSNYFSENLAQECLRVQMEQERFGRVDESAGTTSPNNEIRLAVTVDGSRLPVILRAKDADASAWDILDGNKQEWVGTLPDDANAHLKSLVSCVEKLFLQK
jgi:hypothetical protein